MPCGELQKGFLKDGTTLATPNPVKRSVTYREVTVAIGIVVAMVIALTLWVGFPDKETIGNQAGVEFTLPTVKQIFENPQLIFPKLSL